MSLLGRLLGRDEHPQQMHPVQKAQPQATPVQSPPDITVDPTGHTPYSASTPQLAMMGNRYTADPTNPEFRGIDPALFGYPADISAQSPTPGRPNPAYDFRLPTTPSSEIFRRLIGR